MAFFQLVLKARKVEKARLRYEDEKLRSLEISEGAEPRLTLKQRIRRKQLRCRKRTRRLWSRIISTVRYTWIYKKARLLRTDGSLENYIMKSALGFFGGILLTYLFFVFFVLQLNFALSSATVLCSVLGVILTLGLAFSYRVRCIVFLLLPQFFSKRGRQALMAYAFILTITGPGKNTLHNTSVLSESLACGQEQLKQAVRSVIDLIKQPFYALRDAISKVIRSVKAVVRKIKRTLLAIKRLVLSILRVITSVFQWLGSVVNICNKKLGTPFDRCQKVFEGAVADCKAKLGPLFGGICNLTYVVGALCYVVKPLDFICMLVSYVADAVVDAVRQKIKRFTRHMRAMFYVKVKFSHSFHYEVNQSRTLEDVSAGIITEVRSRTDRFLAVFDWMSFVTAFFIFFMLLRVMHYRHKWLTSERFDNQYLTDDLRTIDLIRTRQDKETVLPLNQRERNQYVPLTSVTLIKVEKVKLTKSAVFLGLTTFKICIHMMADYSLYWILSTIRFHGRFETKVQRPNSVGVHVSGNGYLADLYRSIVRAFTPRARDVEIDATPCLPDPSPPDLDRYTQIVTLIAFCWIMAIFEPYGLRLRHVVMCKYHPERAKQRAAWLYNHIIRSRGSFLKYARRQLRRKFGMAEGEGLERVTLGERCRAICPFLNRLFPRRQSMCLLCGVAERPDQEPHVKCPTPGCVGLFCIQCFADLQNLCTICRSPLEYGDLTDMSEEKDSSDDQLIVKKEPAPIVREEELARKPEEEAEEGEVRRVSVEKISERMLEEKLREEKIPSVSREEEEEMSEERRRERAERVIVERRDEAVQTDDESSSDSLYSYTYQDESPREIEVGHYKAPFRDVEAQKVREDVTIQIFNDSLAREIISSSEDTASCFVVRARRRLRGRLKRKSRPTPRGADSSSSGTSIADTESWPTEEIDEEEVIHIEVGEDGSEELLLRDGAARGKRRSSRVKRIVAALAKIPWLGKEARADGDGGRRAGRPSLLDRIVRMLPGNQSTSPARTYRRIRTARREGAKREGTSAPSSSSSAADEGDERTALLRAHDRQVVDCLRIAEDSADNIYSRDYDSHRARRRTVCRQPGPTIDDANRGYAREGRFATRRLPRCLRSISKDTTYFEVDETEGSRPTRRCARPGDRVDASSDSGALYDERANERSSVDDGRSHVCACTTRICDVREGGEICQSDAEASVTERSDEASRTEEEASEADEESLATDWERSDRAEKTGETPAAGGTSSDAETISSLEKVRRCGDRGKSLPRNGVAGSRGAEAGGGGAGAVLRGVTYRAKGHRRPVDGEVTKRPEARVDGAEPESAEFEEGGGAIPGDARIAAREIGKIAEMPGKNSPGRIAKGRGTKGRERSDGASRAGAETPGAAASAKGGGRAMTRCGELGGGPTQRRPRDKATLIKEKQYRVSRRKPEKTRDCDVQTQSRSSARPDAGFSRASATTPGPADDAPSRREAAVPALEPAAFAGSSENRQVHPLDGGHAGRGRSRDAVGAAEFANGREARSRDPGSRSRTPERVDRRGPRSPRDARARRDDADAARALRRRGEKKNTYATAALHHAPRYMDVCSSQRAKISSLEEESRRIGRRRYDVDVRETGVEIPRLKRYLPAYQTPGLIEELKEHDRMRLIREREARRRTALSALRAAEGFPLSARSRDRASRDDAPEYVSGTTSVSTQLTEKRNTFPYQETQVFKDVLCELRKKVLGASERPLISLSRRADQCKDLMQLFPPKTEDPRGATIMSKFDEVVNRLKPVCTEREGECGAARRCERELSEASSISGRSVGRNRYSSLSTSADETTDDNDNIP